MLPLLALTAAAGMASRPAPSSALVSRRSAIAGLAGLAAIGTRPAVASTGPPERQRLLDLIAADSGEADILAAIEALLPLDPSKGRGAALAGLGGRWELVWSANAEAFSPLLGLPRPIRPASVQLLGSAAESLVGKARVANQLIFPLDASFLLSSGVQELPGEDSTLEILPPFRFEVLGGGRRVQLVEAGSDAEFRALNVRDEAAQAAPRNKYQQKYVETNGRGDLRISEVISGDPVIVGSIFVHQRL